MVFRVSKSSISLWASSASSADETEYKSSDNLVQALVFHCLILVHLTFFCCLSFSTFFLNVLCSCVWCAVSYHNNMIIY